MGLLDSLQDAFDKIRHSMLPEILITKKIQIELDKEYLDFIVGLYLTSKNPIDNKNEPWFLKTIATCLQVVYPNRSKHEYVSILSQIICMRAKEKK